ncbi:MAG: hypothetical protein J1E43_12660 [Christensenellaceae bacterium]|nr:hypothetical protein [Christensenellaceae bacterium]
MKHRKYVMLFGDTSAAVNELGDEAAGRLFKAILRYAGDREEVALPGEEKLVYRMLINQFVRDDEAYLRKSEKNRRYREAQQDEKRPEKPPEDRESLQDKDKDKDEDHDKDEENDKDKDKDKEGFSVVRGHGAASARGGSAADPLPRGFTPPTPQEVRSYCQEAGLTFDPVRFCDYNASRGWMLGARPMTDWRAAARVWASRGDLPSPAARASPAAPAAAPKPRLLSHQSYPQREYANNLDALDAMMAQYFRDNPDAREKEG